ncbi:MAG: DUF3244 domain-containing protein [Marinoscillum sp.]
MKHSIKHVLALLTVFSATMVYAGDSAYFATVCKITAEEEKMYRVMFHAAKQENVSIQIFDQKKEVVYTEKLKSSGFVKKFDLSYLPKGKYQIEVKSEGYLFQEDFELGSVAAFYFDFTAAQDKSISLVGSQAQGKNVQLYILDDSKDVIYQESFDDTKQVHKKYNFEKLNSQQVTFLLYHDDQLIKKQEFGF